MKAFWDARYQEHADSYGELPNKFIEEISARIPFGGRSLAIAEGEGRNALYLAKNALAQDVVLSMEVWDFSSTALEHVRRKAEAEKVNIAVTCLDLEQAEWPENSYENIFCVYGHFSEGLRKKTLEGVRKALKHGGWFVGEVYSKEQVRYGSGGPQAADLLYDMGDFYPRYHQDFFYHFYTGEVERHEGMFHNGTCHVIQFAIQIRK